jgi:uncharacterized protein (TIRG00374 family)
MSSTARKILIFLVTLGAMGALLYGSRGAISLKGFSWRRLGDAVGNARLDLLLLSVVAIYGCYWIRGLRWARLSRHVGPAGVWSVYAATLMGFVAIVLLGRPGEPVRPLLIARRERLPASAMFGIYVVERIFDISVTVLLAGASLIYLPEVLHRNQDTIPSTAAALLPALQRGGFLLFAGLLAAVLFLIYLRVTDGGMLARAAARWREQAGWRKRLAGLFSGFLGGLQAIRTWGDLITAVLLTAIHWVFIVLIYHWILASFGGKLATLNLRDAMLTLACAMLGSLLQLPVVGGGAQVGSFLAMKFFLGVDEEPAIVAAATLWLVTFASCTLVGIPLLLREGMSLGELRRMTRDSAEERGMQP